MPAAPGTTCTSFPRWPRRARSCRKRPARSGRISSKSGSEPEFVFTYAKTNSGSDPDLLLVAFHLVREIAHFGVHREVLAAALDELFAGLEVVAGDGELGRLLEL